MGTNNTVLGPRLCFWTWWKNRSPWGVIWSEIMNGLTHHTKKLRLSPMEQHERDMVRRAPWNNCHAVGEWDGDAGDEKKKEKTELGLMWCYKEMMRVWTRQDNGTEETGRTGEIDKRPPSLISMMLSLREITYCQQKTLPGYQNLSMATSLTLRFYGKEKCRVSEKQILTYTQSLLFIRFFSCVLSVITGVLESIHYSYLRLFLFFWL